MIRKSEELNRINDYDFNRIVESFDNEITNYLNSKTLDDYIERND